MTEYSIDSLKKLRVRPLSACRQYSNYTTAALEDECLKAFLTSEKNQRFYYAQAEYYIRRINVYKPLPIFVLYTEDIPEALTNELQSLDETARDDIITNVVRRIYQAVDPDYFAVSGVWSKVKWHWMENTK